MEINNIVLLIIEQCMLHTADLTFRSMPFLEPRGYTACLLNDDEGSNIKEVAGCQRSLHNLKPGKWDIVFSR